MAKRCIALFALVLFCFSLLTCRLMLISTNSLYAQAAYTQSAHALLLDSGRGNFFDARFRPLTGTSSTSYVLAPPTAQAYKELFDIVPALRREQLYAGVQKSVPFLIELEGDTGINYPMYTKTDRYLSMPIAQHLIGYCNEDGQGVAGLEAACNSALNNSTTQRSVFCAVSAKGDLIPAQPPREVEEYGSGTGVMLTLDAVLQRLCEGVAQSEMDKGCIIVMETATGRVRASVSMPTFNPSDLSLPLEDTALVNRAANSYSVGSVYKPLLAAAALEQGLSPEETYECMGSIEVDGHTYGCAYGKSHGIVNLQQALAVSCNGYFARLGLRLGGKTMVNYSQSMGFGESNRIYGAAKTSRGSLPTVQELNNTGALASLSFGQGTLMATPLQITAFMNVFANGGVYVSPSLVEGLVDEYRQTVTQSLYSPVLRQSLQPETAKKVQEMLVGVVEQGLGVTARPMHGGAGGKTGSAQTGRFLENGEEIMDAWFSGFYPAENPQYTVTVLLDSGVHGSEDACRIFSKITSALYYFMEDTDLPTEVDAPEAPDENLVQTAGETNKIPTEPLPEPQAERIENPQENP